MFILDVKKHTASILVLFSVNVPFVYAAENMLSDDEVASLIRCGEIDAHNIPLKATDSYISSDKLNTSALCISYLNRHKAILADCHTRLAPILAEISLRQFDENVHALDPFIGKKSPEAPQLDNLDNLLNIARALDMGKIIPLNEAKGIVRTFNIVSDQHLNALCADFDERHLELFARVATLAEDLYVRRGSDIGINQFITITDNWTTHGGCFQGRRNRLYIALASMMANIGV